MQALPSTLSKGNVSGLNEPNETFQVIELSIIKFYLRRFWKFDRMKQYWHLGEPQERFHKTFYKNNKKKDILK